MAFDIVMHGSPDALICAAQEDLMKKLLLISIIIRRQMFNLRLGPTSSFTIRLWDSNRLIIGAFISSASDPLLRITKEWFWREQQLLTNYILI